MGSEMYIRVSMRMKGVHDLFERRVWEHTRRSNVVSGQRTALLKPVFEMLDRGPEPDALGRGGIR